MTAIMIEIIKKHIDLEADQIKLPQQDIIIVVLWGNNQGVVCQTATEETLSEKLLSIIKNPKVLQLGLIRAMVAMEVVVAVSTQAKGVMAMQDILNTTLDKLLKIIR